jgi:hypothetical protein
VERDLADLLKEAVAYKKAAFALSTKKTYCSQLKMYLRFCLDYACSPLPISQKTLLCYVAYLARKISAASVPNYLNVVRLLHLEAGYPNPLLDNFELGLVKKRLKRERGVPPVQKDPITLSIKRRMHVVLDLTKPSEVAFWAVCVVGFFGFLRKSTMLPPNGRFDLAKILKREDVSEMCVDSFVLTVHHSKVLQFSERVHSLPFARCEEFVLCPVRSMLSHFGASPLGLRRPLFNYCLAGREVMLTQSGFVTRLKSVLHSIGLNSGKYSAHSFRRGGASYAFELGLSPLQIKLRGDWSSDAYEKYVFISTGAVTRVARSLAAGVSK